MWWIRSAAMTALILLAAGSAAQAGTGACADGRVGMICKVENGRQSGASASRFGGRSQRAQDQQPFQWFRRGTGRSGFLP